MLTQHLTEALTTCETLALQSAPSDTPLPIDRDWITACQTVSSILVSMGLLEESYRWQTMALDPSPSVAKVYAHSGRVYISCEDWQQAIHFCERALALQPDNTTMYCRLAKLYHQVGNYQAESQTIHALLQQQPNKATADGHYQLAKVMEQNGLYAQAIECYQQALQSDPAFLAAYYALGELFSNQGEQGKTIELLQALIRELPDEAIAHYRLGRAYRQAGDLESALLSFRTALALDSELHWAYIGLLNVMLQLKRWAQVVEVCKGVLHFEGELPWAYCFMGNAQAHLGNAVEATTCHQKAFELRGWAQCTERGYQFGQNWFSENIPLWERHLLPLNGPLSARPPLHALLLGSDDGSSACWLLDMLLRSPTDQLLCMTANASQPFEQNAAKLLEPHKLILQTGEVLALLEAFEPEVLTSQKSEDSSAEDNVQTDFETDLEEAAPFSIIYLQPHLKTSNHLNALAARAWPLLQPGGVMIFKNYRWQDPNQPELAPKIGIDAFIESVIDQAVVLHRSHQVIVSKRGQRNA